MIGPPVPCSTCGPQPAPIVHTICHVGPQSRNGCGHSLDDHTDGLKCRICKQECGIYCRPDTEPVSPTKLRKHRNRTLFD